MLEENLPCDVRSDHHIVTTFFQNSDLVKGSHLLAELLRCWVDSIKVLGSSPSLDYPLPPAAGERVSAGDWLPGERLHLLDQKLYFDIPIDLYRMLFCSKPPETMLISYTNRQIADIHVLIQNVNKKVN